MKALVEIIRNNLNHRNMIHGPDDSPEFGTYVISGMSTKGIWTIGYICQIRRNWGAFGSNLFFIREPNEDLMTHENQCFWKLTDKQVELVKPHFKTTPAEELKDNPELSYTVLGKHEESGFIISDENAPDRDDCCTMAMTITTK